MNPDSGPPSQPSFNLFTEPWIPILRSNGRFQRLGILPTLAQAASIRQIAASNPMDNVSLLRFLLAVLLWCRPDLSEEDRQSLDGAEGVPEEWLAKLHEHREVFNLLGDGERFYQDASLNGNNARPIADLLVEFPGADSVNHMRHIVHDGSYGFCPACCALGILRLSVWAPANMHYPASVNPGSAAYAIVQDRNLLHTLLANLPTVDAQAEQAPWLMTEPPTSPRAVARLAWRPRRLWLNAATNGHCACCGQAGVLVKCLCVAKGWPTPVTTGQQFGKEVLAEFQNLNDEYKKRKTERRKCANKVVMIARVVQKCRMPKLMKAVPKATKAPPRESDAARIARVFDQLFTAGDHENIKYLTKKATKEEQPHLQRDDTQVKKFWVDDPHLLKATEAIGLPNLEADVALHASKFWRDALNLRGERAVAVGVVGDGQYLFHDTPIVTLPSSDSRTRADVTSACSHKLRDLRQHVTPNPDRQHPEINAAFVLMTPDTEARIRAMLNESDTEKDDTQFLKEVYQPLVEQIIGSTTRGSPLRRREAMARARSALDEAIRKATQPPGTSTKAAKTKSSTGAAKPKRTRKKKGDTA